MVTIAKNLLLDHVCYNCTHYWTQSFNKEYTWPICMKHIPQSESTPIPKENTCTNWQRSIFIIEE